MCRWSIAGGHIVPVEYCRWPYCAGGVLQVAILRRWPNRRWPYCAGGRDAGGHIAPVAVSQVAILRRWPYCRWPYCASGHVAREGARLSAVGDARGARQPMSSSSDGANGTGWPSGGHIARSALLCRRPHCAGGHIVQVAILRRWPYCTGSAIDPRFLLHAPRPDTLHPVDRSVTDRSKISDVAA